MRPRTSMIVSLCGFGIVAAAPTIGFGQTGSAAASATSPDGRVRITVGLERRDGAGNGSPVFEVSFRGRPVVSKSRLGVDLADGPDLGDDSEIESVKTRTIDETYTQFPGKRRQVVNRGEEAVVAFRERSTPPRRWEVVIRAHDDGAALRYRFPAQDGWKTLAVAGDRTRFRLPAHAQGFMLPLKGFTSSHEARYQRRPVAEAPADWLLGLPLLAELPGAGWIAIAEADLTDYAGMYLARDAEAEAEAGSKPSAVLAVRLSPRPAEPAVAVRADLPHQSPWRVVMIADRPERLVESDLVLNLNPPRALADVSWIKPGKTTFPWWNGFHEAAGVVPFKMGLNTETAKYYIDFCAEAGIPYHSLDGVSNVAWYGGPIVPYEGADITRGIDGLDLRATIRYAASRGVGIRLWMHWKAAQVHMERAFPLYREWGVEGVMLDFMDRDDQEMVRFLRRAVETAAANRLTVTLHGVGAPTGLERTYPNLLTHEAVMNLEYDKWDDRGITPDHETTVPFTRMLAGPLDFHQGSLRGVPPDAFHPRNDAPLVIGTPCRMLASYVVFQNHLPMAADYPSAYRGNPGLPILTSIPASWDDTRCLAGEVGALIVTARRNGPEWWVGAMGGTAAREVEVPLAFLGAGRFKAEIHRDDLNAPFRIADETKEVTARDVVREALAPAGGLLIRLTPAGK